MDLLLDDAITDGDREAIRLGLRAFNDRHITFEGPSHQVALVIRDEKTGAAEGGLTANLFGGWMFIEMVFVPEARRGQDLGTALMRDAEDFARSKGAVGIYLDTFSFQARGFYEKLGYALMGTLNDFPPGSQRHYLHKYL